MEVETFNQLKTLIETLTHSGLNTLDEEIFRRVKKICKSHKGSISYAYDLVLKQLKKNNSQIRLAAFQICKELFSRSAEFREKVVKDLDLIFEYTIETSTSGKLPLPKSAADVLKQLAISTLKSWVNEYGEAYKKLKVAYNYLEKCKKVKFETLQFGNGAEELLENEHQRHVRIVNGDKIRKVLEEFNNHKSEIEMTITSLSNCLCLLLPPADEFFIPDSTLQKTDLHPEETNSGFNFNCEVKNKNDSVKNKINNADTEFNVQNKNHSDDGNVDDDVEEEEEEEEKEESYNYLLPSNNLREFGMSSNYCLSVEFDLSNQFKVIKTEENCAIIENAKDYVRLITSRFLPMVKMWIKIYCKCTNSGTNDIKNMIGLKESLEKILKKYNLLGITEEQDVINDSSSSGDDEFEEVRKEGYEDTVNFAEDHLLDCFKNMPPSTSKHPNEEPVPSTSNCNSKETKASTSTKSEALDRKSKLLALAPKLPYDIDLYHWEDENLSAPTLLSTRIDVDKFWGSAGADDLHEIPHPEGVSALRTRVIEFTGTFEPVKWACRAPLPNGKLCPRRDRFKCPFHGKIVPRNEMGIIENEVDQMTVNKTAEVSSTVPDWQDPELLKDLQASTGIDLRIPEKRRKKRKFENRNLTHKKMKTTTAALKLMRAKQLPGLVDVVKKQNDVYARLKKKILNRASLRRVCAALDKLDRRKFRDKFADQFNYT